MESDWQNQIHNQKDRLLHLFQYAKFTDCCFAIGDSTIPAHKLILSQASPVFEQMFYGKMAEKDDPIIITDIQLEVFQTMIKYIYSECIEFNTFDMACQLYYAAKKYLLIRLMEKCATFLSANLNPQNVCQIFEFADFFDEPSLKQKCFEFISARTGEVLANPSFTYIKMSTMLLILDQDTLNINSELDLFNAITCLADKNVLQNSSKIHRSKNDEDEIDEMLTEAVKKIRFLTMTPQEFAGGPARSKLLQKHEALDILIKLNFPNNNDYTLPEGFSNSRCTRNVYSNVALRRR